MPKRTRKKRRLTLTALRIYRYMALKGGWVGVREVQRALGLSSPGLAAYHLSKLVEEGLVERSDEGKYRVKDYIDTAFLREFVKLGRLVVPRYAFYATFTAVLTTCYISLYPNHAFSEAGILGIALGVFSTISFIYEALRALSER